MQIPIKNMVCPRCVMAVEQILDRMEIPYSEVSIGSVTLERDLQPEELQRFDRELQEIGFEILQDRKQKLAEEIKVALLEMINTPTEQPLKTSTWLSERFNLEYTYLSSVFSEVQDENIEKYLIKLKIEKAKELISYDQSMAEIADRLQYSSVAHLSNQFKKITGMTPSEYRKNVQLNQG
ncbi:helix-turn-helix domain-containing protein [Sphingobacterium lactis]|uniref:helix-turn-helix domain-containing protein n=1 Tax=Sphingobacterium lactis TaxID=797291 RepID=UPI003DA5FA43